MNSEFGKVLDLIRRTKERLVFYDSAMDSAFVILNIEEYEQLTKKTAAEPQPVSPAGELTREEILAKINQDMIKWRTKQELHQVAQAEVPATSSPTPSSVEPKDEEGYYFEPIDEQF
ncbi:MAG: hypothetical protein WC480_04150 [Patescibacteria group bacterium]